MSGRARTPPRFATVPLLACLAGACETVVITVVEVSIVEVTPSTASLTVGDEIQLTATLRDGAGNEIVGREVLWSSDAPAVATVRDDGRVTAEAPGIARIAATAGEASDTATVEVRARPAIGLDPGVVAFDAVAGGSDPWPAVVRITNAGGGTLGGLAVAVAYGVSQPIGWLATGLNGTTAPANLTLRASTGVLAPGSYRATITVASPAAANSPQSVIVTLDVALPPVPTAPSDVKAMAISSDRIDVTWKDTSAHTRSFRIERRPRFGLWKEIAVVPAGTSRFSDTGLAEETRYHYRLRACNSTGCSPYSKEASAWTRDD